MLLRTGLRCPTFSHALLRHRLSFPVPSTACRTFTKSTKPCFATVETVTSFYDDPAEQKVSVKSGDLFQNRYRVQEHIDGDGKNDRGTVVWVAEDSQTHEAVALKINNPKTEEPRILKMIDEHRSTDLGAHFMTRSRASFDAGVQFQVLDLYGPDVFSLSQTPGGVTFSLQTAKRVIAQVMVALDVLHRKCGVVHGDIRSSNVLIDVPNGRELLASSPVNDLNKHHKIFNLDESLKLRPRVKLTDFGCAVVLGSSTRQQLGNTIHAPFYQAPEVILGAEWGTSADVWNLGCWMYEMVTSSVLFANGNTREPGAVLGNIVSVMGEIPSQIISSGLRSSQYYNAAGGMRAKLPFTPGSMPLHELLAYTQQQTEHMSTISEEDMAEFFHLLNACLQLDPTQRATVQELLEGSAWLGNDTVEYIDELAEEVQNQAFSGR